MHYLVIKCISNFIKDVEPSFFDEISKASNIDLYTLKQKFIGYGWAILKKSDREEELSEIKRKLDSLNIFSILFSDADLINKEIVKVSSIKENNELFLFSSREKYIIESGDKILFIAGVDSKKIENVNIKKLLLENQFTYFIYSVKNGKLFKFEHEKVNYAGLQNFSKYSKSENFLKLKEILKTKASQFFEDLFYCENFVNELYFDFDTYSLISSLLVESGFYTFSYDSKFYNKERREKNENLVYDFDYKIYKPGDILTKKRKLINRLNLLEIFLFPMGILLFIILFFLRIEDIRFLPYIFFLFLMYYLFYFVKIFKLKIFLESIPFSKIESISVGLNEIKGRVCDLNSIPSPISGTKCVYFMYKKFVKVSDGKGNSKWKVEHIGEYLPDLFFVKDEKDNAIGIRTDYATFHLQNKTTYRKTFYNFFSMEEPKDVKYEEEILPVDSDVFVVGSVIDKNYLLEKTEYIKSKKSDRNFIKKFDINNDNIIDQDEWETARSHIEKDFERILSNRKEHENLELVYSKDDGILFISDISEKTFIKYANIFLLSSSLAIIILIILIIISGGN